MADDISSGGAHSLSSIAAPCRSELYPETIKLLLDARKISDGGIGTYIRNLVSGLSARRDITLTVLVREREARDEQLRHIPRVLTTSGLYSFHELVRLGAEVPWRSFTLFHTPHFVLPLRIPIPSVVTIHDLNHLYHPERPYYPVIAFPYFVSAIVRARGIIAVSRQTAQEIARFSWRNRRVAEKVSVIPNCVAALAKSDIEAHNDTRSNEESGSVPKPYFLAVISTDKPHKGVADLLTAFGQIADQYPTLTLVIIGAGTPPRQAIPAHLAPRIRLEGLVDQFSLWRWYRAAEAVIVASRQEGFCLPVIEAHAVGVPVVARPVSTLTEVVTADDEVAADMSVKALGDAMSRMMHRKRRKNTDGEQERLIEHAARYSIAEVTARTVDCYQRAMPQRERERLNQMNCERHGIKGRPSLSTPGEML